VPVVLEGCFFVSSPSFLCCRGCTGVDWIARVDRLCHPTTHCLRFCHHECGDPPLLKQGGGASVAPISPSSPP
jgi:hypothetical protein